MSKSYARIRNRTVARIINRFDADTDRLARKTDGIYVRWDTPRYIDGEAADGIVRQLRNRGVVRPRYRHLGFDVDPSLGVVNALTVGIATAPIFLTAMGVILKFINRHKGSSIVLQRGSTKIAIKGQSPKQQMAIIEKYSQDLFGPSTPKKSKERRKVRLPNSSG